MGYTKWIAFAGVSSIVGGLLAILLTLPFAAAYDIAYSGQGLVPFWFDQLRPVLIPFLRFGSPHAVYNTYGRIYDLVYLLLVPAAIALHRIQPLASSKAEKWGFRLTMVGLLSSFIGVAGDYWADGVTFFLEIIGLLILCVGSALFGIAFLRNHAIPSWCSWLLILCLPGFYVGTVVIGGIPSGTTFLVAIAYVGIGGVLLFKKTAHCYIRGPEGILVGLAKEIGQETFQ